uniref:Protease inhibitor n=1 Tax=Ceratitis capitata TaxID=7213 RepID=W8BAL4_CERCA
MAARVNAMCLRAIALIILISVVSSAPQHKQNTQKQPAVVGAGGGPTATGGQTRVQDPKCLQPKEPGPCRMNLDRYYYNAQTNNCELFKFGGCRGNDNKFGFLKTCEDACKIGNPTANNTPATAGGAAGTTNAKAPVASAGVVPKAPAPPAAVFPKAPAPAAVLNPKTVAVAPNPTTNPKTPIAARA